MLHDNEILKQYQYQSEVSQFTDTDTILSPKLSTPMCLPNVEILRFYGLRPYVYYEVELATEKDEIYYKHSRQKKCIWVLDESMYVCYVGGFPLTNSH